METLLYILIAVILLLLIIALSIANYSGAQVVEVYNEVNEKLSSSFTVASNFAETVNKYFLGGKIKVAKKTGLLTDSYIPSQKTVFLSEQTYGSSSIAALAITAHELGHALQDYENPQILQKRQSLGLLSKVLGVFMMPLIVLGIFLFFTSNIVFCIVCLAGAVFIFLLALFVKSLTIKIEKDASKKAINFLKQLRVLEDDEIKFANKLLSAALLTYIGDFLRAILSWTMLTRKSKLFTG